MDPSNIYEDPVARFAEQRDGAACESVCRATVAAIEAQYSRLTAAGAAIACSAGCHFCCHSRVGVFPHEAIALFHYLRTAAPRDEAAAIEERLLANARRVEGMTIQEHYAARIQCAFLVDGHCRAYGTRPSTCARYHSLSRARCESAYEHPEDVGTPRNSRPALLELQTYGAAVDAATTSALDQMGLSSTKGELSQMLRALIEDPNVVERWGVGEAMTAAPA